MMMIVYFVFFVLGIVVYLLFNVDPNIKTTKWTYGEKLSDLRGVEGVAYDYLDSLINEAQFTDSLHAINNYLYSSRSRNLTKAEFNTLTSKSHRKEDDLIFNEYRKQVIKQHKSKVAARG